MKKRSLLAAIAMLVVSAIVLTSSTYAWFASNTSANIEAFTADVGNAQGSVYISADQNVWRSTLTSADFSGVASALTPVSYDKTNDHFAGGQFAANSTAFTVNPTATASFYTAITVYVYCEVAGTVLVTPTLADIANVPYVYASAKTAANQVILGTSGDKYLPVKSADGTNPGSATDNNAQNGIIGADEIAAGSNIALGDEVSVTGGTITLNMEAGEANAQQITFYVWAEGNDSNCTGTSTGAPAFNVSFQFTAA